MKYFILIIALLSSCQQNSPEIQGKQLFEQTHIGKNNVIGCISCHTTGTDIRTTGPSLYGIGLRAGLMIKGTTAQQYLRESIINPDAFIVSGYLPAVMYAHYHSELTEQEIDSLISYLLTLK